MELRRWGNSLSTAPPPNLDSDSSPPGPPAPRHWDSDLQEPTWPSIYVSFSLHWGLTS